MPWVKTDDQFQGHPKFLGVSLAGVGLWVAGNAYCSNYLTDGHVPAKAIGRLAAGEDWEPLVKQLTEAGLWHDREDGDGWDVHDYLDYNPSAEDVRAVREKRAIAGRKGGQARPGSKPSKPRAPRPKATAEPTSDTAEATCLPVASPALNPQSRPVPSRPVPELPTNCPLTSSSSSGDATSDATSDEDDGDDVGSRAKAACDAVGTSHYRDARSRGLVKATNPRGRRAYEQTCQADAWIELGAHARSLAAANPQWSPIQLAEAIQADDEAPPSNVHPLRPEAPAYRCPGCGAGAPHNDPTHCSGYDETSAG